MQRGLVALVFVLTAPVFADEPIDLFAGDSFARWTAQNGEPVSEGWKVENGVLHFDPARGKGGNIVTAEEIGNFELSFEFKIAAKGNSGIKYRVQKYGKRVLGLEYQILDDPAYPNQKPKHFTASLYDIKAPVGPRATTNEFNRGRIVVRHNHIQHWLNGQLVVSQSVSSGDWDERIAGSKFKDIEGFSTNQRGKLMLTDHNSEVWYRNVKLRVFAANQPVTSPTLVQQQLAVIHCPPICIVRQPMACCRPTTHLPYASYNCRPIRRRQRGRWR